MRHIARHEGARSRAADRHLVADQKGDLALQHIGELVAVVVQMQGALCAGRDRLLEHHHAVAGVGALQFEREFAARRVARPEALSRLYDDALRGHSSILPFIRRPVLRGWSLMVLSEWAS